MLKKRVIALLLVLLTGMSCTHYAGDKKASRDVLIENEPTEATVPMAQSTPIRQTVKHKSDNFTAPGYVTTEATVPIVNGDVEQAKNMAIYGAMRRTLDLTGAGIKVETYHSYGIDETDAIWAEVENIIEDWELVDRQSGVNGEGYHATIRSWVKSGTALEREKRNLLSFYKVMIIADGPAAKAVERTLTTELRKTIKGVRLLDSEFVENNVAEDIWFQLRNRHLYNLFPNAFKFEADLVIHIDAGVHSEGALGAYPNIKKYNGHAIVRLFQLSGERKGEAIVEGSKSSSRLFITKNDDPTVQLTKLLTGTNPNYFGNRIARPVSAVFIEKLIKNGPLAVPERTITLEIQGLSSPSDCEDLLDFVQQMPGVREPVRMLSQKGGTTTLDVRFPMNSIYLANLIGQNRRYEMIGHGRHRIAFRVKE